MVMRYKSSSSGFEFAGFKSYDFISFFFKRKALKHSSWFNHGIQAQKVKTWNLEKPTWRKFKNSLNSCKNLVYLSTEY